MNHLMVGGIFIPVTNLRKSIEWYTQCLGAECIYEWPENSGADFVHGQSTAGFSLVKVEESQPTEFKINEQYQNCYYNFTTFDIKSTYNRMKNDGVEVTELEDHGMIIGFDFIDPDGNPFSVVAEKENSPHYDRFQKLKEITLK